jgi:uncharacterized repeat protein (TIGR03803 family)
MKSGTIPQLKMVSRTLGVVLASAAIELGLAAGANAQTINLVSGTAFTESNVILDSAGNLYGTTQGGGTSQNCKNFGCGTVFAASPVSGGGWTSKVIYNFTGGTDGEAPAAGLALDSAGNLYGTTQNGGGSADCPNGCGTIFELSPNGDGTWTETILHKFTGKNDGSYPLASLIIDPAGNLYGTASDGGAAVGGGVVFKLYNAGGRWKEAVLHNFVGTDGQFPSSALLRDAAGNLYGTTTGGGAHSDGVVFRLAPVSGGWKFSQLHDFTGAADGNQPVGDLAIDSAGRIYGATLLGGYKTDGGPGYGVVYRLANAKGVWRQVVLYTFMGAIDGSNPSAGVAFDLRGNLYGTTEGTYTNCTTNGCGQVFQLTRTAGTWNLGNVYPIPSGLTSLGGLTRDAHGNCFFTASDFHYFAYGDVYELTP